MQRIVPGQVDLDVADGAPPVLVQVLLHEFGEGVGELKIDYGPGYRVYFGQIGSTIVVLLNGGDKKTQIKDIPKAKEFWQDFKKRYHGKKN